MSAAASASSTPPIQETPTSSTGTSDLLPFKFNDLNGDSSIVNVYGDPSENGRNSNIGTYANGQTAVAECKELGRSVTSDAGAGETLKTSAWWLRVHNTAYFATVVYTDLDSQAVASSALPTCNS